MKIKFPKLQGFLVKPTKNVEPKEGEAPKLNVSSAFVYQGHIVAITPKTTLFFNLKEYLKYTVSIEDDENPQDAFSLINKIAENLDGRTLSREFFAIFSKTQKIVEIDDERLFVEHNGLHSEYLLEPEYDVQLLSDFLNKIKKQWTIERSEQGEFGIQGAIYDSLVSVLKSEISNDSLVFKRTTDDKMKFCLIAKDFIFGITMFDTETESSITKFGEADDFFDLNVN